MYKQQEKEKKQLCKMLTFNIEIGLGLVAFIWIELQAIQPALEHTTKQLHLCFFFFSNVE